MRSPLSGVEKDEYFDVLPYAKAISEYLISLIGKIKLPRKLKVGFSNSSKNIVHATYRDMGFVAKQNGNFVQTLGAAPLTNTYSISNDRAGTYQAVITFTASRNP